LSADGVARDDQCFHPAREQIRQDLARVPAYRVRRLGAIRDACGVAEIDHRLVRQALEHRPRDGEPTDAGIEDAQRGRVHGCGSGGGGVVSGTWADKWTGGLADRSATTHPLLQTARPAVRQTAFIAPPSRAASPAPRAPCTDARPARAAHRPRAAATGRRAPLWPPLASETGRPPASCGASRASRAAPP